MLEWKGEEVTFKTEQASKDAINRIMADCVEEAKGRAPVRSGKLKKEIMILKPAEAARDGYIGRWGVRNAWWAWMVETGSKAHVTKPKNKKALSWASALHPVMFAQIRAIIGRPFLGPSIDIHYPKLARYIAERL